MLWVFKPECVLESMESLFVVRKGGLGNQMFQVAAGLLYAKKTGKDIILPLEQKHVHNSQNQDYAETVFRSISHRIRVPLDGIRMELLVQQGVRMYPGEPGFEPWSILQEAGPICLHGYFQYYPPIAEEETYIRSWFLSNLQPTLQSIVALPEYSVGVHVRRGDFLAAQHMHPILPMSYYQRAIAAIEAAGGPKKTYVLFSDDIEWCKQQPVFQGVENILWYEEKDEIKVLAAMTQCTAGFICANSTFSWWGAFLGAYAKRAPVYIPPETAWIKTKVYNLFPREWIRVAF